MLPNTVLTTFFAILMSVNGLRYGSKASPNQFPYSSFLASSDKELIDSAVLLSDRWALSHVISHIRDPIYLVVGTIDSTPNHIKDENLYNISKTLIHPSYSTSAPDFHPLALVKTEQSITFGDSIQSVKLRFRAYYPNAELKATICGWGRTQNKPEVYSEHLNCASFVEMNREDCQFWLSENPGAFTPYISCFEGVTKQEKTCWNDAGSAAISGDVLIGITMSARCDQDQLHKPTIVYRLDKYLPWIVEKLENE